MNPSSQITTDVLIIGAGPVGLTLANELARRGIRVRVVEKLSSIREVSKALILHVRTQEALDKVGIMQGAVAEAEPMREVVVHGYGKHIGSWHMDGIDSPYPHPLIIGQNRTQHLLNDALGARGVAVEWNTEAVALEMGESGAVVTLRAPGPDGGEPKEEAVHAAYVVGCEGSRSLVRKTLGLTFEGEHYSGEQFIQADCRLKWSMPAGRSYLFLTTDGYMMVIELPGGVSRLFISLPDSVSTTQPTAGLKEAEKSLGAAEDISSEPTLEEIKVHFERLSGLNVNLSDPLWLARYRTSHRYANKFSEGRAFVAGDAGHVHVPIGGQGMNTGIQDAFNLGWKLAGVIKEDYHTAMLDTYNQERHPVAERLIKGTDFAYKGILHPSEIKQKAVRLFGPYVMRTEVAQNFMRNTLEELTISYPHSQLTEDHGGSNGPRAGESAPDATVVRHGDLSTVRLNDLFHMAEWTLLIFSGTHGTKHHGELAGLAATLSARHSPLVAVYLVSSLPMETSGVQPSGSVLVDALQIAHNRYGVTQPALYGIRPDGYVGFRGPSHAAEALTHYLESFISRAAK